ncbi:FtsX-like permease family protein [Cytophagaceae bacterium ABcell3]|nr:FtsX-like permease family protein [Cytophagaceae bacterium ABcell3]
MRTIFLIARRYFLSKKKKSFINVISMMSMAGVAFGTMALVIVLSVFNGMEDLIRTLYNTFDPEIKVSAAQSKSLTYDDALKDKVYAVSGIEMVTEAIEDNALVEYRDDRRVVKIKGVSENFLDQQRLNSAIVAGEYAFHRNNMDYAIIGRGVQYSLNISINNDLSPLKISYPNHRKLLQVTSPNILNRNIIPAGAVFAIEKQYDDNYIFVPLHFAQELMNYGDRRTSLEIKTKEGYKINKVRDELRKVLGGEFLVQNSDEQHASLLRAIKIEKLFVFITFSVILAIASLNIFFSLTMLAIDKKKDVAMMFSMGATPGFIRKIFMTEGIIIAFSGAIIGLMLGFLICLAQQELGLISMGMETSLIDAYPVKMEAGDFVFSGLVIFAITILISYRPAVKASRVTIQDNL